MLRQLNAAMSSECIILCIVHSTIARVHITENIQPVPYSEQCRRPYSTIFIFSSLLKPSRIAVFLMFTVYLCFLCSFLFTFSTFILNVKCCLK